MSSLLLINSMFVEWVESKNYLSDDNGKIRFAKGLRKLIYIIIASVMWSLIITGI